MGSQWGCQRVIIRVWWIRGCREQNLQVQGLVARNKVCLGAVGFRISGLLVQPPAERMCVCERGEREREREREKEREREREKEGERERCEVDSIGVPVLSLWKRVAGPVQSSPCS